MPRIRTLKPDFFRSPDTAKVDFATRIFYQALWCWADDFGVGETNINGLLGFAFPDDDEFTAQDVRRFCAECAQHFGVTFYTVRGRHFYWIPTWEKHQKLERRSERRKNPPADHPDAVSDLRFHPSEDSAPQLQRETGAESGEKGAGTGEQGNRGTGEQAGGSATEVCHQGPDRVAPPPEKCPRHLNDENPPSCGACASRRRARDKWEREQAQAAGERAAAEAAEKAAARETAKNCPWCHGTGVREIDDDLMEKCDHKAPESGAA